VGEWLKDYPIDDTAAGFMGTMKRMGDDLRKDIEVTVNNVVDKTFNKILADSPVDKGNYIASHRMAKGAERTDFFDGDLGGPQKSAARREAGIAHSKQAASGFRWNIGDDEIWFSNNVGHALDVELGGPRWVHTDPYVVYEHAEKAMENIFIPEEMAKL